jgi:hypothetical protein
VKFHVLISIDPTGVTNTTLSPIGATCSVNPCQNGGVCSVIGGGGFICNCTAGFTGLLCETAGNSL